MTFSNFDPALRALDDGKPMETIRTIIDMRIKGHPRLLTWISYCLMPTHLHFVVKQECDDGLSIFMRRLLNAYSNYFNRRHNRKGPLWQERFGNSELSTETDQKKVFDYIWMNPVKAGLVKKPEDWPYHLTSGR